VVILAAFLRWLGQSLWQLETLFRTLDDLSARSWDLSAVSSGQGDVHRRQEPEFSDELKHNTKHNAIAWTQGFGAANNWAAFLVFASLLLFSGLHAGSYSDQPHIALLSKSIPMPTMLLKTHSFRVMRELFSSCPPTRAATTDRSPRACSASNRNMQS